MRFTKIAVLLFAVALVPQITFAAWWNPFSWFKKAVIEDAHAPLISNTITATTTVTVTATTTTTVKTNPVVTPTPKPTGSTKPTTTAPASPKPTTTPAQPATKPAISVTASATVDVKPEVKIDVPTYVLSAPFTPAIFSAPRTIKNGLIVLSVEASKGSQAIGEWYIDSVTWRTVSDSMRSGDITVSISAGSQRVEDSLMVNESHTTKLSGHVASDPITFDLNGQIPNRGTFHVVVESISGHTKSSSSASYNFGGTPLVGPDFRI